MAPGGMAPGGMAPGGMAPGGMAPGGMPTGGIPGGPAVIINICGSTEEKCVIFTCYSKAGCIQGHYPSSSTVEESLLLQHVQHLIVTVCQPWKMFEILFSRQNNHRKYVTKHYITLQDLHTFEMYSLVTCIRYGIAKSIILCFHANSMMTSGLSRS